MVKITFDVPKAMQELAQSPGIKESPYDICLECPFRGQTCDGPNGLAMSMPRWVAWNARLASRHRVTRATIAESAGIPLATVNSIMSGRTEDPRHSTMKALSKAYSGGCWGEYPCHFAALLINNELVEDDGEVEEIKARLNGTMKELDQATQELGHLRERLQEYEDQKKIDVATVKEEDQRKVDYLKGQIAFKETRMIEQEKVIRSKERAIGLLGSALFFLVLAIIAILIYDKLNPDMGWFRS